MLMIPLLSFFVVLIVISTSPTYYSAAIILTSTFTNLSATLSNSMSIIIMPIMKPPIPYNFITLFNPILSFPVV